MFGNISRLHWWIHRFGKYGSNPIFRLRYKQFHSIVNTTEVENNNTSETSTITGKLSTEEAAQESNPFCCVYTGLQQYQWIFRHFF